MGFSKYYAVKSGLIFVFI